MSSASDNLDDLPGRIKALAGASTADLIGVAPFGRINCGECVWACPIGVAPPRLGDGWP